MPQICVETLIQTKITALMKNRVWIYTGLIVFMGLVSFPVWYGSVQGTTVRNPDIVVRTRNVPGKSKCVMPVEYMRASHMRLLADWREAVVRTGDRSYTSPDGRRFRRSLTNTCLDCHSNKSEFCDRCHQNIAAQPNCWDCHVAPHEEVR